MLPAENLTQRGKVAPSSEATLSKRVCFPLEKGSSLKVKESSQKGGRGGGGGENYFLLES